MGDGRQGVETPALVGGAWPPVSSGEGGNPEINNRRGSHTPTFGKPVLAGQVWLASQPDDLESGIVSLLESFFPSNLLNFSLQSEIVMLFEDDLRSNIS